VQVSLRLFGLSIIDLTVTTDESPEDDKARDLSGGTTVASPIGFSPSPPDPLEREGYEDRRRK
jgi:hypothetical protein